MFKVVESYGAVFLVTGLLLMLVSGAVSAETLPDGTRVRSDGGASALVEPAQSTADSRAPQAESVHWSVLASGGGTVTVGGMNLGATIGQTFAGAVTVGDLHLNCGFWQNFGGVPLHCCLVPTVGDVDQSGAVDITDLQVMIDHQFLSLAPLVCDEEGDIDFSHAIDITDLQIMIDYQYISLSEFPPCP